MWVSRRSGNSAALKQGDVIALYSPTKIGEVVIKRVVGVPGSRIKPRTGNIEVGIPVCHYWIEGDNAKKRASVDSNFYGPVSEGLVLGLVTHILWPPHRWQKVNSELTSEQAGRVLHSS